MFITNSLVFRNRSGIFLPRQTSVVVTWCTLSLLNKEQIYDACEHDIIIVVRSG